MSIKIPALVPTVVSGWPRLAWVTRLNPGGTQLELWHGPHVEVAARWFVEGAWSEAFSVGRFDRSENFFGSGACIDQKGWVFVSSCATVDRLWVFAREDRTYFIANSLPALIAVSGVGLDCSYTKYRDDMNSVIGGWKKGSRNIPATNGVLRVVYFSNIAWDGARLEVVPKSASPASWHSFGDYRDYLFAVGSGLAENARAAQREHPLRSLTTISSGYDSPVASIVGKVAGATTAVTIERARSLIPRSDSGAAIAEKLQLRCKTYRAEAKYFRDEEWFIAALGWSMDLNFSLFDYPDEPTMLFTGFHGDKVWEPNYKAEPGDIVRGDPSGTGFCEARLSYGVINIAVPFMGIQHTGALQAIAKSSEMKPWVLGGDYDRPIPRRIIEEAGVDRMLFGQRKSATTIDDVFYWPQSARCRARFESWLEGMGIKPPVRRNLYLVNHFRKVLLERFPVLAPSGTRAQLNRADPSDLLFCWANTERGRNLREQLPISCRPGGRRDDATTVE